MRIQIGPVHTAHHPGTTMSRPETTGPYMWPRFVNLVAGIWLFISAFAWPHSDASRTNTWIVGVLIVVASAIAFAARGSRSANTLLSIWLFFSTIFIFHESAGTLWNNLIVAVIVFAVSLTSGRSGPPATTG